MVFYKYIGYGVTDENGVAKLDYDAEGNPLTHSYTGTGAGEVDVVASLDNPVLEGSIVSEIYEVLDCIKYDINNSLPVSDYTKLYNADTLESVDDHKEFTTSLNTSGRRLYLPFTANGDFTIELEVKFDTNGNIGLWESPTDAGKFVNRNNSDWNYFKLTLINGTLTIKQSEDGIDWTTLSPTGNGNFEGDTSFRLLLTTVNQTTYFRNIKIYPI